MRFSLMRAIKSAYSALPISIDSRICRAGVTVASNIVFSRIFNARSPRGPLFLTWLTTFDCNVFCKFCATHALKKRFPEAVSRERALSLAGEIGRAGTWVVGFTGGEVFLWPHLFEVIRVLKQHRLPVYIVTNGLLLKEMTDEILASGVDYVVVSLDSDNPREHDFLRSCPGLFDRAVEGIQHLKRKRTVKMPVIKSTTLLTRMSLPRMGEIIDNLARIVDVAAIQPIVNNEANCPHRCSEKIADLLFFPSSERREAEELIARFSRAHPAYDNAYIRNITTYWFDPDSLVDAIHCWSPFLRLVVMPNGDVFHCTFNPRYPAVGNVNRSSLMEIWNSPEMRRQREEIRLQRNRCICWTQDSSFNVLLKNTPLANRLPVLNRMDRQNRYVGSPPH